MWEGQEPVGDRDEIVADDVGRVEHLPIVLLEPGGPAGGQTGGVGRWQSKACTATRATWSPCRPIRSRARR